MINSKCDALCAILRQYMNNEIEIGKLCSEFEKIYNDEKLDKIQCKYRSAAFEKIFYLLSYYSPYIEEIDMYNYLSEEDLVQKIGEIDINWLCDGIMNH